MGLAILFIIMYEKHKDQHCDKPLQIWMLVMGISQGTSNCPTDSSSAHVHSGQHDFDSVGFPYRVLQVG